jgi:hypothetical protein
MKLISTWPAVRLAARCVIMVRDHQLLPARSTGWPWTRALTALLTAPLFFPEKILSQALPVAFQALVSVGAPLS